MKTIQYFLVLAISIALGQAASAQGSNLRLGISYSVGIPTGSLRSQVDAVSARGFELRLMKPLSSRLSLGLQGGFQDFYQKYPRQVYHAPGSDLSAVVTNSIQVMPVLLKAQYNLAEAGGKVQPYLAIGAGANFVSYNTYYGEFVDGQQGVRFAAQPEVGLNLRLGSANRTSLNLGAAYNYMPFTFQDANGLSHVQAKAGVTIVLND